MIKIGRLLGMGVMWGVACLAEAETTAPLNVMTYNIRTGNAKDGLDAWPVRRDRTVKVIRKYNPDVMGLQEVMAFQQDYLREKLPEYGFVGAGRNDGVKGGEVNSIFYRKDRLELLETQTFWLSDTPDTTGSVTWGNAFVRICTTARFRDRRTSESFYLFNTHFDHVSQPSREKSAELMLRRLAGRAHKDPVIVTGDFNAGEENGAIATLKQGGLKDSFRVMHPDVKRVGTTCNFNGGRGAAKIDYIFVDDRWAVMEAGIHGDKVDGRWPSDHLPVTAKVDLK